MCKTTLAIVLFCLLVAAYGQGDPPDTVDELIVELYVGRWYQVGLTLIWNEKCAFILQNTLLRFRFYLLELFLFCSDVREHSGERNLRKKLPMCYCRL